MEFSNSYQVSNRNSKIPIEKNSKISELKQLNNEILEVPNYVEVLKDNKENDWNSEEDQKLIEMARTKSNNWE